MVQAKDDDTGAPHIRFVRVWIVSQHLRRNIIQAADYSINISRVPYVDSRRQAEVRKFYGEFTRLLVLLYQYIFKLNISMNQLMLLV